jgi:hypothetical protein
VEGVDARGERAGATEDAPARNFREWLRRRAGDACCRQAERDKYERQVEAR